MNRRTFAAVSVASAAVLLLAVGPSHAEVKVGAPAPEFSAVNSEGKTVNLNDYRGKTVVLEWTNDGCPYVRKHYGSGNMQALQKKWTDQGIVWLSIISSPPGEQGFAEASRANSLTAENAGAGVPTFGSAYDGPAASSRTAAEEANRLANLLLFISVSIFSARDSDLLERIQHERFRQDLR